MSICMRRSAFFVCVRRCLGRWPFGVHGVMVHIGVCPAVMIFGPLYNFFATHRS